MMYNIMTHLFRNVFQYQMAKFSSAKLWLLLHNLNSNPLQCSCLEGPMDRGAWQATVHGVTRVGQDLATILLLLIPHLVYELCELDRVENESYLPSRW